MNIETAQKNFPKGQKVIMMVDREFLDGITIENVCSSPTQQEKDRLVVRIKWDDKSESIENIRDLSPQPDLSFLNH